MTLVLFSPYVVKCVLRKAKFLNIKKYQPSLFVCHPKQHASFREANIWKGYILTNPRVFHGASMKRG